MRAQSVKCVVGRGEERVRGRGGGICGGGGIRISVRCVLGGMGMGGGGSEGLSGWGGGVSGLRRSSETGVRNYDNNNTY